MTKLAYTSEEISNLSTENFIKTLKNFGLTEKEAEIYIFIAKTGVQKSGEIAKAIKTHRSEVYRILKSLQTKGLVESTLEAPTRFTAVHFETAIDSFIRTKKQEAAVVETAKQDLLENWNLISGHKPEPQLQKFIVIEGRQKIYSKILKMTNETKNHFSVASIVPALLRADEFGILDAAFTNPLKSQVQFRFLTELTQQNLDETKAFLKKIPAGINLKGKTPELGLKLYPQMIIKDDEEAIFFIKSQSDLPTIEQDNTCLWTNCKSLVLAFLAMFEESWSRAINIQEKIDEMETGKPTPKTHVISDATETNRKYTEIISMAQKEILMITSSKGISNLSKNMTQLKELSKRGVSVKIMTPITKENSKEAQILSDYCEVKHAPTSYLGSTIIDGQHLFQFQNPLPNHERTESKSLVEDAFYTSETGYVQKTKKMFNDIWRNIQAPSDISLESIMSPPKPKDNTPSESALTKTVKKITDANAEFENQPKITEKDLLSKILYTQLNPQATVSKGVVMFTGTGGQAIIHTPASLNLPDMLFHILHYGKNSAFGAEDMINISLWRETPNGNLFVGDALVTDNSRALRFWKKCMAGMPLAQNIQLVKKDELEVRIHGNTLFCGWTVEIPLLPPQLSLKPACILLEGYGTLKTGSFTVNPPSGLRTIHEYTGYDAFVTFISPKLKYSGPGTDGFICRDLISTTYLLRAKSKN